MSFVFRKLPRDKNIRKGLRVLDLGCGSGNNTWMLAREGFDTHAIDGSRNALVLTGERLAREGLSAHLIQGDFSKLPYEDDFFDAIVDDASVEANTVKDVCSIFNEVYRVLKKGGIYFGRLISSESTSVICASCAIERNTFTETKGGLIGRKRVIHLFENDEIEKIMADCGFSYNNIGFISMALDNKEAYVKFWLVEAAK